MGKFAERYDKIKSGQDIVDAIKTVDDLIDFLDEWLEREEERQARYDAWRKEHKTCQNCKHWESDGEYCNYWDDVIEFHEGVDIPETICGHWR